jgi:hypothetical protein
MADAVILGGKTIRDFAGEYLIDCPENSIYDANEDASVAARCPDLLRKGIALVSRFQDSDTIDYKPSGATNLLTPEFPYLVPERGGTVPVRPIGKVSLLAHVALEEDTIDLERSHLVLYAVSPSNASRRGLLHLHAAGIIRHGNGGEIQTDHRPDQLSGGHEELNYLNMIIGGIQEAAFPRSA